MPLGVFLWRSFHGLDSDFGGGMDSFWSVMRSRSVSGAVRFALGFVLYVAASLLLMVLLFGAPGARANPCGELHVSREGWIAACAAGPSSWCAGNPSNPAHMASGSCNTYNGDSYPACWCVQGSENNIGNKAFVGECPTGTEGPNIEFNGEPGDIPPEHCHNGCLVQTNDGPNPCTYDPVNGSNCLLSTEYGGGRCYSGGSDPNVPDGGDDPNPENCGNDSEGSEVCVSPDDGDGDNSSSNPDGSQPEICLTVGSTLICRPIAPNPNAGSGCDLGTNAALCTNGGNGGPAPLPGSPYPDGQPPDISGNATSQPGGQTTEWSAYGVPLPSGSGPPDENGNCPGTGQTVVGGTCRCPPDYAWNGSTCLAPPDPGDCDPNVQQCDNGEEREATDGNCTSGPTCSGDAIDCVHLKQTWYVRCALRGTDDPPFVDLSSDPLGEYGGADALFDSSGEVFGVGDGDESGLGWGSSCPQVDPIQVLGSSIQIPSVWCETAFFSVFVMLVAYVIAIRIAYGSS